MKTERRLWMGPLVGVVAVVGCAQVFGIDKEYRLGDDGNVEMLGGSCPQTGQLACAGHAQKSKLICGPDGKWATNGTCDGETLCNTAAGLEQGTCKPLIVLCAGKHGSDIVCDGTERVRCGPDLVTTEDVEACPKLCVEGKCGVCKPESKQCAGNTPQTCNASGAWQDETACSAQTGICIAGACVMPPSCVGLPATCGPNGDELCCASPTVPRGSFNRSNDPSYPATVSSFRLDRFEITVGRFRKFVEAYPGSKPKPGDGAHPLIADSGWYAAWDANLPATKASLITAVRCDSPLFTWTDAAGPHENWPMNCIDWYVSLAFCAWDGGRLPTDAEWNYAAVGGNEQRLYPWVGAALDATYALYDCSGYSADGICALDDILHVGSRPKGDGKWGQADLSGSMFEWNLDWYQIPYPSKDCNDCININNASMKRVNTGGSWNAQGTSVDFLRSPTSRGQFEPLTRLNYVGGRCARMP